MGYESYHKSLLVACVQTPPPLSENRRRGVCDSPLLIVYGGHVIFPGMCGQ